MDYAIIPLLVQFRYSSVQFRTILDLGYSRLKFDFRYYIIYSYHKLTNWKFFLNIEIKK